MRKLSILFILLFTLGAAAKPIPGSLLFVDPELRVLDLSPDSKYVAAISNLNNEYKLLLFETESDIIHTLTTIRHNQTRYFESVKWVNESTLYISLKQAFGPGRHGFMTLKVIEGKVEGTFRSIKQPGVVAVPERLKGKKVIFIKPRDIRSQYSEVFELTPDEVIAEKFNRAYRYAYPYKKALVYLTDESGDIRFCVAGSNDVATVLYLDDKNRWQIFQEVKSLEDLENLYLPVGKIEENKFAVITNAQSDTTAVYEYDIKTQSLGNLIFKHDIYDLIDARLDRATKKLKSVTWVDHGQPHTEYFSAAHRRIDDQLKKAFRNKSISVIYENELSPISIISVYSSDDPGNFYTFNRDTLVANHIGSLYSKFNDIKLSRTTSFEVSSDDGKKIEAMLTQPIADSNRVLLVMPHGGPVGVRDTANYNPVNQYFASRGYSILNVNFRGSVGFGKEFLAAGRAQFGKDIEADITSAVNKTLDMHGYSKVCAVGGSYGGYSSMMLALNHPQTYDCVVAMYGVFDLPLLFNASNVVTTDFYRKMVENVVGEFDDSLYEYSPLYKMERFHKPVLLIAGKQDRVSYFEQTNRMKYRLEQLNADYETVFYKNAGHGHESWEGDQHQYAYIDDFLRRKLDLPKLDSRLYKEIVVEESVRLADSFSFKGSVELDHERALYFYKKAADSGDARSMFNYASYYHRGEGVEEDIQEAILWYEKAFAADYDNAGLRLGDIYSTEPPVRSANKAIDYYLQTGTRGREEAFVRAALIYFKGESISRDIAKGVSLLEKGESSEAKLERDKVLADSAWISDLSLEDKKLLADYIRTFANTGIPDNWSFRLITLDVANKESGVYKINSNFGLANKDIKYQFKLNTDQKSEKDKPTFLSGAWIYLDSGESEPFQRNFVHYLSNATHYHGYLYKKDFKSRPGRWALELKSVEGNVVLRHEFTIGS